MIKLTLIAHTKSVRSLKSRLTVLLKLVYCNFLSNLRSLSAASKIKFTLFGAKSLDQWIGFIKK